MGRRVSNFRHFFQIVHFLHNSGYRRIKELIFRHLFFLQSLLICHFFNPFNNTVFINHAVQTSNVSTSSVIQHVFLSFSKVGTFCSNHSRNSHIHQHRKIASVFFRKFLCIPAYLSTYCSRSPLTTSVSTGTAARVSFST